MDFNEFFDSFDPGGLLLLVGIILGIAIIRNFVGFLEDSGPDISKKVKRKFKTTKEEYKNTRKLKKDLRKLELKAKIERLKKELGDSGEEEY